MTTGKAAEALGVSLTTLQRWAHQGLVTPALRTAGGHFRWDLDDLRGQLRAMDPTAQHDSTKPEPSARGRRDRYVGTRRRPVGADDGEPPWTFIAGEIEPGESRPTLVFARSRKRRVSLSSPVARSAVASTRLLAAR